MKKIVLYFCLMISAFVCGQNRKLDSLWKVYHNETETDTTRLKALHLITRSYSSNNPDTALILGQQELDFARNKKQKVHEAHALYIMGLTYRHKGNYKQSLEFCFQALKIFEDQNFKPGITGCYNALGNIYSDQADYPSSLKYYLKLLKFCEENKDRATMGTAYVNIGNVYLSQNDLTKALDHYLKGLKLKEEAGDKKSMSMCYANIGAVYAQKLQYDTALSYYLKDLKISEEMGDKQKLANGYIRIGIVYLNKPDLPKALDYFLNSIKICKEIGYKRGLSLCYVNIGELYRVKTDYKKAINYADSSLLLAKEMGDLDAERTAYQNLASANAQSGKYKEAFNYYVEFKHYTDSIFNEENSKQLGDMKTQFEVEKKEAELKAQSEAHEAIVLEEKKRQQVIIYAGAVMLFLVIVFAVFMFNRFRITKKQKHIIELQKEMVDEKQKEILDSISYAKRLQEAILPAENYWAEQLPNSFVLYKPKDIVAGDFYWMEKLKDRIFFAAADCTGHGVPGALVSVVCSNALNRTLLEFNITEPGKILDKTRELVIATFEKSEKEVKDGMDISLCCLNTKTNELFWSGANNPLWYIRNGQMEELKPDKQPIGKYAEQTPFTTHKLELKKEDTVYIFTDGYADQFGGPKGKKFKYKTLQELLISNVNESMAIQKQKLNTAFENWKGELEQVDDVCVIGIKLG